MTSEDGRFRLFNSGTTTHGAERVRDVHGAVVAGRPEPLTYYHHGGPIGDTIEAARRRAGGTLHRVAAVGLGMGALSCYSRPGENWTFYELDPLVVKIAENPALFRAIKSCAPNIGTAIGDGRLKLKASQPGFDLIVLDAFSSDSIPVHMLTREAMAMYVSKLAPHGVIAIHITNRNMELKNVAAAAAASNGFASDIRIDRHQVPDKRWLASEVIVVARSATDIQSLSLDKGWQPIAPAAGTRVWTDDYSDVLGAMLDHLRG
ncbi:MAG: fused MFS/spermidine synthase [Rhizomicrobium sp.]